MKPAEKCWTSDASSGPDDVHRTKFCAFAPPASVLCGASAAWEFQAMNFLV